MNSIIFQLTAEEAQPFEEVIKVNECSWCKTDLTHEPISAYPHLAGWTVKDHNQKLWLFKNCPKCNYDWALWKLGVNRE